MTQLLGWLKDVLFPKICIGCKREGEWLCEDCLKSTIELKELTSVNDKAVPDLERVTALFSYGENTVSELIKMFKYNYLTELEEVFVKIIDGFVIPNECEESLSGSIGHRSLVVPTKSGLARDDSWRNFVVVPVPLHPRRERERGFNQSEIIANIFADKLNLKINKDLRRHIYTKQQAKLLGEERLLNLKDAFIFNSTGPIPEKVLLVDDVFTTGATMNECAKTLKDGGVKVVWGLVLARG